MTYGYYEAVEAKGTEFTGKEMAEFISDWVNRGGNRHEFEDFAEELMCQHRTLQQMVFGLFGKCVRLWSVSYLSNRYDGRNEYTCKRSNEIIEECGDIAPPII